MTLSLLRQIARYTGGAAAAASLINGPILALNGAWVGFWIQVVSFAMGAAACAYSFRRAPAPADPADRWVVVHGPGKRHECPRAMQAFNVSEEVASHIQVTRVCMACGGDLLVLKRAAKG